jgi:DNA mismatch repair protein MutS2
MFAVRSLEFDQIVEQVAALALTPLGRDELAALAPSGEPEVVREWQRGTSETARFLENAPLFPLRAADEVPAALEALAVEGQPLDPLPLRALADFVDSVELSRASILGAAGDHPILEGLAGRLASFKPEVAAVRHAIDGSGEVLDEASPALRSIRDRLRSRRQHLRATLERFAKGRDTAKYLQDEVVTERNGRFVLMVRAEHRASVPGIVHGSSATGATLFLEPAATVEINNDIVELEEREREELFRILLELTDRFRARPGDLRTTREVAIALDTLQARARYGSLVRGVEPQFTDDGALELKEARHPLLGVRLKPDATERKPDATERKPDATERKPDATDRVRLKPDTTELKPDATAADPVVPVDILLAPPLRLLLITGPNTGGKTVALKTAGLLALMAQSGLHVPAAVARMPVFRSVFADIGDEQSIANSLSTFSAHITNLVKMDRELALPALILLDEVGTGTDPNEGGALATALVKHFKERGALVMATTHFDAVKTWGTGADGVVVAAFAFDPQTFAPTYRLVYGAPGRSLAIEIAQRLGMPLPVVASARGFLSDDQKRLQAHLARVDAQARALEAERSKLDRERRALNEQTSALEKRERSIREREDVFTRRLNDRLDDRLRQARRDIDQVIDQLKEKSDALAEKASLRAAGAPLNTGETGAARADARKALDRIVEDLRQPPPDTAAGTTSASLEPHVGARVAVGGLGMEGTVIGLSGSQAEIDVRGKRLRAKVADLRVIGPPSPEASAGQGRVRVNVDLKPREGMLSELNVIGHTVEEAIDRVARFLDDTLVTDLREVRIVHGHGTGQLRRGLQKYLKEHPLVQKYYAAPENQGGGGATIVELKE